jgi:phenylacetate-CoA ligase
MLLSHLIGKVLKAKKRLKLTNPQIKEHQLREFRELAKFAAQNSNFYKKIVTENNIDLEICVPEDFPILDKNTLMENWDDIVTDKQITKAKVEEFLSGSKDPGELFLNKYYVMHTSGSSGQVGYYIYSESEFAAGLSHSNRISGTIFLKKISYVGATKGHFAGATMVEATKKLFPIYSGTQMLDINDPFDQIIKALNEFQPNVLTGYSFALKKLAEAKNSGELNIHPRLSYQEASLCFLRIKNIFKRLLAKRLAITTPQPSF